MKPQAKLSVKVDIDASELEELFNSLERFYANQLASVKQMRSEIRAWKIRHSEPELEGAEDAG